MTPTEDLDTLYADDHSQEAFMHPIEIIPEATAIECPDHPMETEPGFTIGVGYCGGGFGRYKRCGVCRRVFNKMPMKDGND